MKRETWAGETGDRETSPEISTRPRPTLSRRDFLLMAGVGVASLTLSACSSLPVLGNTPGRVKVSLVYQDTRDEWYPQMVEEMLAIFHETHPNIHVIYTPEPDVASERETRMLADMQAGTAPDVFQGCCTWFPIWAQKGYTLDLRPFVQADLSTSDIADWNQAQYQSFFLRDGSQYGLPKYNGSLALYYNKDLLDLCGVDYPDSSWDHEDYRQAMARIARDRDGDDQRDLWGSMMYETTWDRVQMHVNAWGGHLIDPTDPTRCRMAEEPALAAVRWLQERMWVEKVMATRHDTNERWPSDAFVAGDIAMVEDGSWGLKTMLSRADFRLGIAPLPAGPVRRVTLATTDGFGIYAGTHHPEAAWELVKFLVSKDYGRAMARVNFLQPARASLLEEWADLVLNQFPGKARKQDIAAFADGHVNNYAVTAEVAANMAEASRIATEAWESVFTLGKDVTTTMQEASRQIEEAQKQARSTGGLACAACDGT